VAGCAPRHHSRLEILRHGRLSDRDDPIKQHRYAAAGCRAEEADTCSDVGRSQCCKPIERIFGPLSDPIQRGRNHPGLVSELIVIHAGATPGHLLSRNSEGRAHQSGCGRGVADPHIADDQQIGAGRHLDLSDRLAGTQRRPAIISCQGIGPVDRLGRTEVVSRNLGRDILKIIIDTQIEHPQRHAVLTSQAVSAREACDEGAHHHRRDLPRIGGDAVVRDAMITSQDHRSYPVQRTWWTCRLAGRHPRGQML
jgi:hypothetical protein